MSAFSSESSYTSSSSTETVHDFSDFVSIINDIRIKYGFGQHELGISWKNNFGTEKDNINNPLSFLIFFGELIDIQEKIEKKDDYELNIYKALNEVIKIIPGFPGGGRSFIEIPLNISIIELPKVLEQIKHVIEKFRESFKYGQKNKTFCSFNIDNFIENIDFLTCLPENGGSPQIEFSIKYVMKNIILVISVDSYWQPAIKLLMKMIGICIEYASLNNSSSSSLKRLSLEQNNAMKEIYTEFKQKLLFQQNTQSYQNQEHDPKSKTNIFKIPDFTFCELMSYLHRNAILTKLIYDISKITNSNNEKIIQSFKNLLTDSFTYPIIQKSTTDLIEKDYLNNNNKSIRIQLIDSKYVRNAVHTSMNYVLENDGSFSIWFSKRLFNKNDFYNGEAIIFYGDHDGCFFVDTPKTYDDFRIMINPDQTKFIASKDSKNKRSISIFNSFDSNNNYISRSMTTKKDENWYLSSDIFHPFWLQYTDRSRKTSTQKLFGLKYPFYVKKNTKDAISFIKDQSDADDISFENNSKEIIPFQLYNEDIGLKISYTELENSFLIFDAVHQWIRENFGIINDNHYVNIIPTLITVKMIKSLDHMDLEELIEMQILFHEKIEQDAVIVRSDVPARERRIIYAKNHNLTEIRNYFMKNKKGLYQIDKTEHDIHYGDDYEEDDRATSHDDFYLKRSFLRIYHYVKYHKLRK